MATVVGLLLGACGDDSAEPRDGGTGRLDGGSRDAGAGGTDAGSRDAGGPNSGKDAAVQDAGVLSWYSTCGDPVCGAPGSQQRDSGVAPCSTQKEGERCSQRDARCDLDNECNQLLVCTTSDPKHGVGGCPISRAAFKRDIEYVSRAELSRYHDQLVALPLARYRYRQDQQGREHLGFILEDAEPSLYTDSANDRVDLYAYTSMAVAALQVQAAHIERLEREVAQLKEEIRRGRER